MKSRNFRRLILLGWLTWSLTAAVPGGAAPAAPSLDLKEALGLAWKANPTLQISRLQSLIAGEEVVRARSGFLPTVKSEVSQTINDNEIQSKIPVSSFPGGSAFGGLSGGAVTFPTNNRNFWSSKTYLDQTIFDFWGTPSRYQAAVLGKSASLLDTAKTRDDLFLNVAKGYFSTLRAQKLEVVATQDVADLQAHLKIARDQYEFGVVTYNDVLQAEVSLADAQQRLIVAKTDTIDIRSALNKVLALPVSAPTVLKDENLETRPWVLEQATDEALKQRSDLKASANRIQQQEKVVTQTKSQFYPRFYAQAGLNYQKNEFHAARHDLVRHLRHAVDPVFRVGHQGPGGPGQAEGQSAPGAAQGPERTGAPGRAECLSQGQGDGRSHPGDPEGRHAGRRKPAPQ